MFSLRCRGFQLHILLHHGLLYCLGKGVIEGPILFSCSELAAKSDDILRKLTRLDVVAESVAGINATLKAAAKRNAESPRNAGRARPAARSRPRSAEGFDA